MHRKAWLSVFSASPRILSTRSSWTSTSIPQNVGWQFIGHIVRIRRLSLIDSPVCEDSGSTYHRSALARRRNPPDDRNTPLAARRRLENHHFGLVGNERPRAFDGTDGHQ